MTKKLHWRVQPKPTGHYGSFERRGWPDAFTDKTEAHIIAALHCKDDYFPIHVRECRHGPISIRVALRDSAGGPGWSWRTLKEKFTTLVAAKDAAQKFFDDHPERFHTGA